MRISCKNDVQNTKNKLNFFNKYIFSGKKIIKRRLTHALEFLFQLSLVVTICDTEIVIRVRALIHTIRWSRRADRQHGGRAFGALCLTNFLHCHHFFKASTKGEKKNNPRVSTTQWQRN